MLDWQQVKKRHQQSQVRIQKNNFAQINKRTFYNYEGDYKHRGIPRSSQRNEFSWPIGSKGSSASELQKDFSWHSPINNWQFCQMWIFNWNYAISWWLLYQRKQIFQSFFANFTSWTNSKYSGTRWRMETWSRNDVKNWYGSKRWRSNEKISDIRRRFRSVRLLISLILLIIYLFDLII